MDNRKETIESLQKLADFISTKTESDIITRPSLEKVIVENQEMILQLLSPIVSLSNVSKSETLMATVWELLYEKEHIFTNMNSDFQLIRDVVTSPKNFNKENDRKSKSKLVDSRGVVRGVAEVRLDNESIPPGEFDPLWLKLVEQTLSSLDELTADLFDLISYLWLVAEKNEFGYMTFESDYALRLRFDNPMGEDFKIRERERFSIMRRVAALSSIWISMRDDNVTVINSEDLLHEDRKNYDFQTFSNMFDITALKMAYDRTTGEAKGIYSLQIRPTPVIERYLTNSKQTFGPLDMKVFKYHHISQREHKRLTRFLNYQWKIRTLQRASSRPFKVETLVTVMKFAARNKLNTRMEIFRTVLNDLVSDGVIKEWHYEEEFEEEQLLKRGGTKKWMAQNVFITPSDSINALNKEKILLENVKEAFVVRNEVKEKTEQITMFFEPSNDVVKYEEDAALINEDKSNLSLSDEQRVSIIGEYMNQHNLSLRMVSSECGIAAATLMRYLNGSVKKMKKPTLQNLYSWYDKDIKKRH
ncbi:MAG: hypothetical protein KBT36_06445 [Kurthia sp.]|nr:hypothetical protein [Candidatus Kurthia equi]